MDLLHGKIQHMKVITSVRSLFLKRFDVFLCQLGRNFCRLVVGFIGSSIHIHGDTEHQNIKGKVKDGMEFHHFEAHPFHAIAHLLQEKH